MTTQNFATTPVATAPVSPTGAPRTYDVRTHGCQMNVHDCERLAGLLETAGYVDLASLPAGAAPRGRRRRRVQHVRRARERRQQALRQPGPAASGQAEEPRHADRRGRLHGAEGPRHHRRARPLGRRRLRHPQHRLACRRCSTGPRHNKRAEVEILESLEVFPSTLPTRRDSAYAGWVSISVGCNNTCTFCIVPSLRGKEQDRRPGEILAEVEALVAQGVVEMTLLGQNVNTYGVEFGDRLAFGKLLRACGEIEGLERVRFTSPHPAAFTDDVIAAMAETPNVMPSLHMPLQSGLGQGAQGRCAAPTAARSSSASSTTSGPHIPDAAITTDIIVGFPGETEEDFQGTLDVVRESRFSSAFTFQYSIRPGTPAATMADQVPKAVVQERFERLVALQEEVAGPRTGPSRAARSRCSSPPARAARTPRPQRLSGRARDNRLVHFAVPEGAERPAARRHGDGAASPTARRTTSSPTRVSTGGRMPCAAHRVATPGRRSRMLRTGPASRP